MANLAEGFAEFRGNKKYGYPLKQGFWMPQVNQKANCQNSKWIGSRKKTIGNLSYH